ncbi:MAG: STAS domain-containing protein [Waddliaceae bacterium]
MRKRRERCALAQDETGGILIIRARGRLDQELISERAGEWSSKKVALDLNRLEELKTKDLRFLLELSKKFKGQFCIFSENSDLIEMIIMSGLDNRILFRTNETEAISALSGQEVA